LANAVRASPIKEDDVAIAAQGDVVELADDGAFQVSGRLAGLNLNVDRV
jgi:hypothetical protein